MGTKSSRLPLTAFRKPGIHQCRQDPGWRVLQARANSWVQRRQSCLEQPLFAKVRLPAPPCTPAVWSCAPRRFTPPCTPPCHCPAPSAPPLPRPSSSPPCLPHHHLTLPALLPRPATVHPRADIRTHRPTHPRSHTCTDLFPRLVHPPFAHPWCRSLLHTLCEAPGASLDRLV
jgi:hypothetical protein